MTTSQTAFIHNTHTIHTIIDVTVTQLASLRKNLRAQMLIHPIMIFLFQKEKIMNNTSTALGCGKRILR